MPTVVGLPDSFPLKSRFEVRRLLGAGGFGEVYEAFDLQRNDTVALKILRRADAAALYRFKQEFRTLSLMGHPNLVTLYELIAEDDQWFLTMELITGWSFLDHVRPLLIRPSGGAPISVPTMDSGAVTVADIAAASRPRNDEPNPDPLPFEELRVDRLRPALRQLAEGVCALHQNRVLHLDIKPPNVLVDANGRVVLMPDNDPEGEEGCKELLWRLNQCDGLSVKLAWSRAMFGGVFAGRQPESLSFEEWKVIRTRMGE